MKTAIAKNAKMISLLMASTLWASEAYAEFQNPLSDHIGESDLSYIANRCGGLTVSVMSISQEGGTIASHLESLFGFYHIYSVLNLEGMHGLQRNDAERDVRRNFNEFAQVYVEYLNASYVSTGEYMSNRMVLSDLTTCSDIKDHLQNG